MLRLLRAVIVNIKKEYSCLVGSTLGFSMFTQSNEVEWLKNIRLNLRVDTVDQTLSSS